MITQNIMLIHFDEIRMALEENGWADEIIEELHEILFENMRNVG